MNGRPFDDPEWMRNPSHYFRARRTDWSPMGFESPDMDGWRPYNGTHVFIERKSVESDGWTEQDFDRMHFLGLLDLGCRAGMMSLLVVHVRTPGTECYCVTCHIDQGFDIIDESTRRIWIANVAQLTESDFRRRGPVRLRRSLFHELNGAQFRTGLRTYKEASESGRDAVARFDALCFECAFDLWCEHYCCPTCGMDRPCAHSA